MSYRLADGGKIGEAITYKYKCQIQFCGRCKELFIEPKCLTYKAFHTIAIDGMFETFFRYTNKDVRLLAAIWAIDGAQRILHRGGTLGKKLLDGAVAAKFLGLRKCMLRRCWHQLIFVQIYLFRVIRPH